MNQTTIEFLKEHLEYVFIFAGLLILMGAICPLKKARDAHTRGQNKGSKRILIDIFGQQVSHVLTSICGVLLILLGVFYL